MTEFMIKEISPEEYKESLKAELATDGLYEAVKRRCDIINEECQPMSYTQHGFIQEQLSEIMELVEAKEETE